MSERIFNSQPVSEEYYFMAVTAIFNEKTKGK